MIFFDRDSDKKIEITKKLVHLHIKLGEVVEVRILCEFFSLQIILYSWLWNLSLSKYLFSPLQGVDLYIKLFSEVSDDSIKCSLQTELLSLLSRLPSLTQDQEQLVSNISCWTALILFCKLFEEKVILINWTQNTNVDKLIACKQQQILCFYNVTIILIINVNGYFSWSIWLKVFWRWTHT